MPSPPGQEPEPSDKFCANPSHLNAGRDTLWRLRDPHEEEWDHCHQCGRDIDQHDMRHRKQSDQRCPQGGCYDREHTLQCLIQALYSNQFILGNHQSCRCQHSWSMKGPSQGAQEEKPQHVPGPGAARSKDTGQQQRCYRDSCV